VRAPTPLERKQMLLAAAETARRRAEVAAKVAARRAARSQPTEVVTLEQLKSSRSASTNEAPAKTRAAKVQVAHRPRVRRSPSRSLAHLSPTRARAIAMARGEVPATRLQQRKPRQIAGLTPAQTEALAPARPQALAQLAARPAPAPRPQSPPRFAPAAPAPPAPPVNLDSASAERLALALRDVKSGRIQGPQAQVILRLASAAIHASRY
jgi:hypothetical protein